MNELERTALNEILRTVTYIAEKLDELVSFHFSIRRNGMKLRLYSFSRQIKSVLQLLSEVRYGNCFAQTNSSSQQHFAGIVPSTVVEINSDSRF